jgi:DNA-binding Xre family transcriptional regulator
MQSDDVARRLRGNVNTGTITLIGESSRFMITSTVRERAQTRNIFNAHQLSKALRVSPHTGAALWRGDFRQIATKTLDRLCSTLDSHPGELLQYRAAGKGR